jgi:predicted amidophosphoribosyltransferase
LRPCIHNSFCQFVEIRERGFNQVLELLSVIKRKQQVMIDVHSVQRIKATKPLSKLDPQQRKLEIKGAFQATPINYQRILLVFFILLRPLHK